MLPFLVPKGPTNVPSLQVKLIESKIELFKPLSWEINELPGHCAEVKLIVDDSVSNLASSTNFVVLGVGCSDGCDDNTDKDCIDSAIVACKVGCKGGFQLG
jgi:hypothetical protein